MSRLAIIPARGGSKRIPGKNIKNFLGKPIIAYSIETALKSNLFDEVMVSTDDEKIAEVSKSYGAKVPFLRSQKNADDYATTIEVLLEVLNNYTANNINFKYACCMYPTAPLSRADKLKMGFEKLQKENLNSVFPVVAFSYPIWRGLKITSDNQIRMIWPENLNKRSQDLEEVYHDAGQWYWFNVEKFRKEQKIFSENSSCLILPATEVQDIDNLIDWKLAELKYAII